MLLAAQAHIGTKNSDYQMRNYIWKRRGDGAQILGLFFFFSDSDSVVSIRYPYSQRR